MSILYTPAGDTDPIRDCYDGAMLHMLDHPDESVVATEPMVAFRTKTLNEVVAHGKPVDLGAILLHGCLC